MKIAFVGVGVMGEAIISGIVKSGAAKPQNITAADIDRNRLDLLKERHGITGVPDNREAVLGQEVVVLSVKPTVLATVTEELQGAIKPGQLVISIVAGASIDGLRERLCHDSIIRVMPNTPAQIGEGMSVWTAVPSVTSEQRNICRKILAALGKEIYVPEEKFIDMATAVSGSGPAYVFLMIEAMTDAAVHIGLSRAQASEMVLQTFLGSVRYALSSGKHPAELRNMVTSPGGTTAEGLLKLESGNLRATIDQAVTAAYERARELGKEQR